MFNVHVRLFISSSETKPLTIPKVWLWWTAGSIDRFRLRGGITTSTDVDVLDFGGGCSGSGLYIGRFQNTGGQGSEQPFEWVVGNFV